MTLNVHTRWDRSSSRVGSTLAARIARELEQDIVGQGWPVGHLIGSEAALTERFGVGVAAVREAARMLEARGLAKSRRGPGGGLLVTVPERSLVTDAARRYLEFVGVAGPDLFEVWLALEQVAIVKVAGTIDSDGARLLRSIIAEEAAMQDVRNWRDVPNLHLAIARLADNNALELFIETLTDLSLSVYAPHTQHHEVSRWLHTRHTEIAEAVIAGDVAMAQLCLRRYIERIQRTAPSRVAREQPGDGKPEDKEI